jgi:hypothetical protein
VLLEYLVTAVAIYGLLLGALALYASRARACRSENCVGSMIVGIFWVEVVLYFAGLVVVSLICSVIVLAFRQRRRVRGHPASQETGLFGSAGLATAWGFVWGLLMSPFAVVVLNDLINSTNSWGFLSDLLMSPLNPVLRQLMGLVAGRLVATI